VNMVFVQRIMGEYTRGRVTRATIGLQFLKDSAAVAATDWEESLKKVRAAEDARQPIERVRLDSDILRQRYESLSVKVAEAEMMLRIERRQQGVVLEVLDLPSLPAERRPPVLWTSIVGAFAGALLGWLVSLAWSMRIRRSVVTEAA